MGNSLSFPMDRCLYVTLLLVGALGMCDVGGCGRDGLQKGFAAAET